MLKNLTLLGMSGVGKTYLATLLSKETKYYHYSADYRLGATYLQEEIAQHIISHTQKDKYLAQLLNKQAITISPHISFDNLSAVADFLGKVGNPLLGGLELAEFKRRQALHLAAEKKAIADVSLFMQKAKAQGYEHFINDAGGSLCELDDEKIYADLAQQTTIIYIKADEDIVSDLIARAQAHPKPLYYNPEFFKTELQQYLDEHHFTYVAQIDPDDFVRWIFPRLVTYRQPKYQAIADAYGTTILAKDLYQCNNAEEVFALCR